jgi:hypothetical protein
VHSIRGWSGSPETAAAMCCNISSCTLRGFMLKKRNRVCSSMSYI